MYFTFMQNNSFGVFKGPDVIIVWANDAGEANRTAIRYGVYFNGVADNMDCECCGDRWWPAYDDGEVYETPSVYGQPVQQWMEDPDTLSMHKETLIVHRDGNLERIVKVEKETAPVSRTTVTETVRIRYREGWE